MKKDIYIIKNDINDKVYIGQAINTLDRWYKHVSAARKNYRYKLYIDKAIHRYGIQHFYYQILEYQIENYDEREQYWIKQYNSLIPNGYNVAPGGQGVGGGVESPCAKFNIDTLNEITKELQEGFLSVTKLAKKYGVTQAVVSDINYGRSYWREGLTYPLQKNNRYSKELIKQIVYSLQYEYDKSMHMIAREFNIDYSQVTEINQGHIHTIPGKTYPLRSGRVFSLNAALVDDIKKDLQTSSLIQKEIARKYNVSVSLISTINKGSVYHDDNIVYPIRDHYQGNRKTENFLPPQQLREVEDKLATSNISLRNLAKEYGVCYNTIVNINNGAIIKYRNPCIKYPIRKIKK